jgi:hypothetical protein
VVDQPAHLVAAASARRPAGARPTGGPPVR